MYLHFDVPFIYIFRFPFHFELEEKKRKEKNKFKSEKTFDRCHKKNLVDFGLHSRFTFAYNICKSRGNVDTYTRTRAHIHASMYTHTDKYAIYARTYIYTYVYIR